MLFCKNSAFYYLRIVQLFLLINLFLLSQTVLADQLLLKNGDIISGEIIEKESDMVVIKTSYAGELKIDWSNIASFSTDAPVVLLTNKNENILGKIKASSVGQIVIDHSDYGKISMSDVKYINPSEYIIGEGYIWSGNINIGGFINTGNTDNKSFQANGQNTARSLKDRYTLQGYSYWREENGSETQSNSRVRGQYDYFFNKQWYAFANGILEHDRFRDIKLRTSIGLGSGYQFYESPELNLSAEAGLSYINQDYYANLDESYLALRWALNYDQKVFSDDTQVFHRQELLSGFKSETQILIYTQTGLRFPLLFGFNATTQIDYNYDSLPTNGRVKGDTRGLFTLGYTW